MPSRNCPPRRSTRASGRSAPATRRRASRSPRAKWTPAPLCLSWTPHPPPSWRPSSGLAPPSSAPRTDECWAAVETRRSDRMHGRFVHPFDDDDFISGNGTVGAGDSGRSPGRGRGDRADWRRRPVGRPGLRDSQRTGRTRGFTQPNPPRPRRSRPRSPPGSPSDSSRGHPRLSTAPAGARCSRRCGRC